MSDYFNCPRCGYAPKPSDPRARNEGVCDSCWTDLFLEEWYEVEGDYQRRRIAISRFRLEAGIEYRLE